MTVFHEHGAGGVCFWCPACDGAHCVTPSWEIDRESLSILPSVLVVAVQWALDDDFYKPMHASVPPFGETRCHSFVTAGSIRFLPDSTHTLAGQWVDLPDWPIGDAS